MQRRCAVFVQEQIRFGSQQRVHRINRMIVLRLPEVEGLPPGKHAFHVHAYGDCSADDGSSAGPHFDFKGSFTQQQADHIAGDLGELSADAGGKAHLEASIRDATLQGPYSVIGRSIVVHESPNDTTKPPEGNAGGRVACAVIGIEKR